MDLKNLNNALPDVWFDWYARLIPGCFGIIFYYWFFGFSFELEVKYIFLLLFLAYIVGHIIQPISSCVMNISYTLEPRKEKLVSKAYAETISMANLFLITFSFIIYAIIKKLTKPDLLKIETEQWIIAGILAGLFLIGTILRAKATENKAQAAADTNTGALANAFEEEAKAIEAKANALMEEANAIKAKAKALRE